MAFVIAPSLQGWKWSWFVAKGRAKRIGPGIWVLASIYPGVHLTDVLPGPLWSLSLPSFGDGCCSCHGCRLMSNTSLFIQNKTTATKKQSLSSQSEVEITCLRPWGVWDKIRSQDPDSWWPGWRSFYLIVLVSMCRCFPVTSKIRCAFGVFWASLVFRESGEINEAVFEWLYLMTSLTKLPFDVWRAPRW